MIRLPRVTPSAQEMTVLAAWVNAGGVLLMLTDRSGDKTPFNNIMAGVGSEMRAGAEVNQNFYLSSGSFLSDGRPYSLANWFVSPTNGSGITGGTSLTHGGSGWTPAQQAQAAAYIHFQQLGLGYVIAFADVLDVDYFTPSASDAFGRMFLNTAGYHNRGLDAPGDNVPEPSSLLLAAAGLGGVVVLRRRQRRSAL